MEGAHEACSAVVSELVVIVGVISKMVAHHHSILDVNRVQTWRACMRMFVPPTSTEFSLPFHYPTLEFSSSTASAHARTHDQR